MSSEVGDEGACTPHKPGGVAVIGARWCMQLEVKQRGIMYDNMTATAAFLKRMPEYNSAGAAILMVGPNASLYCQGRLMDCIASCTWH